MVTKIKNKTHILLFRVDFLPVVSSEFVLVHNEVRTKETTLYGGESYRGVK